MKKIRRKVIEYDNDTGEVFSEKDYFISPESLIFDSKDKLFIKLLQPFVEPKFSKRIYVSYWYRLMGFLEYNTNILSERKKVGDHWLESIHMSAKRVQEILEISDSTFYRFMKECNEKGFIAECKNKCINEAAFIVSPIYALNGQGISVELYQYFRGIPEIEAALSEKDKRMIKIYLDIDIEMKANE